MKAIISPDGATVLRVVSNDTPSRLSATRRYVDNTGTPPVFKAGTQRLVKSHAIGPEEVVASWAVVQLTPEEVLARQEDAADEAAVVAMRNARATLETGNATVRQTQEILARVIRLLIRKLLGGSL